MSKHSGILLAAAMALLHANPLFAQPAAVPDSAPAKVRASPITLHVRAATLASVVEQLGKQSGNPIKLNPYENPDQPQPTVTLDVDSQPFFAVMDQLCAQTNCTYGPGESGALIVSPPFSYVTRSKQTQRINSGPILLTAERLDHANVLTADPSVGNYGELQISGFAEPRLNVLYYATASLAEQAVDENGVSLVPPPGTSLDDPRVDSQPNVGMPTVNHLQTLQRAQSQLYSHHLILKIPDNVGRRIKHLSGTFSCWVSTQSQDVEITDFHGTMRNPVLTPLSNGLRLAVGAQQANSGNLAVGLLRQGRSDQQWADDQRLLQSATISVVSKTDVTTPSGNGSASWGPKEHWIWVQSDRSSISRIVVRFPVAIARLDVPFVFDNLPMP